MEVTVVASWAAAESLLQWKGAGFIRVSKRDVRHPIEFGYRLSFGIPKGTILHWRKKNHDGSGFHVREYPSFYTIERDEVDPATSFISHLQQDMKPIDWIEAGLWTLGAAISARRLSRR